MGAESKRDGERTSSVSAENLRFSETLTDGKYGKILKDPSSGDVAVILPNGKTAKFRAEELMTNQPEYGSEKNEAAPGAYVSPNGEPFQPRIESRPMNPAEIFAAAEKKTETPQGEPLREYVPKILSEYGIALEESDSKFRLVESKSGATLEFAISGKSVAERRKKAAQMHLVVGKAMEIMRACEAKSPLLTECRAYSDVDPIVSFGYQELKIDDKFFPFEGRDTVVASGEELEGLTKNERRKFAEKLAPFINAAFESRYAEVMKNEKNARSVASGHR